MFNGFDLSTIYDAKYGSTQVNEIYCGSTKIWPQSHNYSRDYLTFKIELKDPTTTYKLRIHWDSNANNDISYRIKNATNVSSWMSCNAGNYIELIPNGGLGYPCYIEFKMDHPIIYTIGSNSDQWGIGNLYIENSYIAQMYYDITLQGNIMSLYYGDNFIGQTSLSGLYCVFANIFRIGYAKDIKNVILPATILSSYCYCNMFVMFDNIVSTPELPATTLADHCYFAMFDSCPSLVNAPELPATILSPSCYSYMFKYCTSLTTAPELPAPTLSDHCYNGMFHNCSSLNYIKCLATDISASSCTEYWVYNVNANGDFYKDANTTWPSGDDGIPAGWNVHNL